MGVVFFYSRPFAVDPCLVRTTVFKVCGTWNIVSEVTVSFAEVKDSHMLLKLVERAVTAWRPF